MKKDSIKLILFLVLGILPCRFSFLGCYPLLVAYFAAVFLENFHRGVFALFMYLWMFLWLPIVSLVKYGLAILITMVAIVFAERMYQNCRRVYASAMAAVITLMMSCGGNAFRIAADRNWMLFLFESIFIFSASYFLSGAASVVVDREWSLFAGERAPSSDNMIASYVKAMGGLSDSLASMIGGADVYPIAVEEMQMELTQRICAGCSRCSMCQGENGELTLTLHQMLTSMVKEEEEDEYEQIIRSRCIQPEELIREAANIFDKAHLNMAWYRRLLENREIIAGQIDAMAYIMQDCVEKETNCDDRERGKLIAIAFSLGEYGVRARRLHYYERKDGTSRLTMELCGKRGNCVPVSEVMPAINGRMLRPMVSEESNRNMIGRERNVYCFVTKPALCCSYGIARVKREGEEISGDNFSACKTKEGRWMYALSDGMGSGYQANRESETVVELMEQFVQAGFSMEVSLRLMNAAMVFGGRQERYSTLDVCLIDGYTGICEFYKIGAHVSFIKHGDWVEVIAEESLPVGASVQVDTVPWRSHIEKGELLVMVTDGVLEYLHVSQPVQLLKELIHQLDRQPPEDFSRKILERVMLYTGGKTPDDMTVLTVQAQET